MSANALLFVRVISKIVCKQSFAHYIVTSPNPYSNQNPNPYPHQKCCRNIVRKPSEIVVMEAVRYSFR